MVEVFRLFSMYLKVLNTSNTKAFFLAIFQTYLGPLQHLSSSSQ